jgi:hypothetical protein
MNRLEKQARIWRWSFFTRSIEFRYLLTPFATVHRTYQVPVNCQLDYLDVYIFGIRIARIHKT